jgi:hypothetical protein
MNKSLVALAGLVLVTVAGSASARVEADANKEYPVTAAQGPWMICVASYAGDLAQGMAHSLVTEVRTRYDLPAFVFNRGAVERQKQREEVEAKKKQQEEYLRARGLTVDVPFRPRTVRIEDQYAVLVGGYPDIDSARRALDYIKKLEAPKSVPQDACFNVTRDPAAKDGMRVQQTYLNPFASGFVVRNPAAPAEVQPKWDPLLKKWNEHEDFSLLKCRQPWTLVVKSFQGTPIIQSQASPSLLEKLFAGTNGEELNASAVNAHNLAEALRKMGFEAYVLHTRTSSVVSVGGFAAKDDPRMDQVRQGLAVLQVRTAAHAGQANQPGVPPGATTLQLFTQPLPMEVPRL